MEWANQNFNYAVHVWTKGMLIEGMAHRFATMVGSSRANEDIDLHRDTIQDEFTVSWWFGDRRIIVNFKSYERLKKKISTETLEELANNYGKGHVIQDIGGFTIVFNCGGIFINKRVKPIGVSVPFSIDAPCNILFASAPDKPGKLTTDIIAAPKGCDHIITIVRMIEAGYTAFLRDVKQPPESTSEWARELQRKKEILDEVKRYAILDDSPELMDELHIAQTEYAAAQIPTSDTSLTDTDYIEAWIDIHARMSSGAHSFLGMSPQPMSPAMRRRYERIHNRGSAFPYKVPAPVTSTEEFSFQRITGLPLHFFK